MKKLLSTLAALSFSTYLVADGNPEYIDLPQGYKSTFTQYDTRNRVADKQVAVIYANKAAVDSAPSGDYAYGSKVIVEIYTTMLGEDGSPLVDKNGLYKKDKFAAVGVMEKQSEWSNNYPAGERAGNWGFALYGADGSAMTNELDCVGCHLPLKSDDYLFSHSKLVNLTKK